MHFSLVGGIVASMRSVSPVLACALFCVVSALSFSLPDKIEEVEGSGIEVATDPAGADLIVDGIRKGKTPLNVSDLRPGTHRLELLKDGYRGREAMILLKESTGLSIFMELETATGKASITVKPAAGSQGTAAPFNPIVLVDGARREAGLIELKAGLHSVRARAFGWQDQVRSIRVAMDETVNLDLELSPADFALSSLSTRKRRFNPLDGGRLGSTEFTFETTGPGSGRISIAKKGGAEVFSADLEPFTTWEQEFEWNGRDANGKPFADGEYSVTVRAVSAPIATRQSAIEVEKTTVTLDSTVGVRPAAIGSGVAGAFYAPQARVLPSRSFQLEGSLLFGDSYDGATGEAPPVAFGVRFSPAERWEAGAAANIIAAASEEAISSVGVSLRRVLFAAEPRSPFSAALALRYAWASEERPAPFTLSSGVEIDLPLELGSEGDRGFFIGLSPGVRWSGNLPDEAVPQLIVAGAAGRRTANYVAALSARTERDLSGGDSTWPLFIGAECRYFPAPSTLVYGLSVGARIEGDDRGLFGGISIGFLF